MVKIYRTKVNKSDPVIIHIPRQTLDSAMFIETRTGDGSINIASSDTLGTWPAGANITTRQGFIHEIDLPETGDPLDIYHQISCNSVAITVFIVSLNEITPVNYMDFEPYYP